MKLYPEIIVLLITYLWGSIPFGYLLTKLSVGENILELGSETIGSTNVRRIAGKRMAVITQLLDMLKGLLPVALFMIFNTTGSNPNYIFMLALAAILGHDFSVFLKFKGGKGVNATLGASLLIAPYSVLIAVAVFFMVKFKFKYVSLGSISMAIVMPIIELILHQRTPTFYYLCVCSILIIFLHRQNIKRLIKKTELSS